MKKTLSFFKPIIDYFTKHPYLLHILNSFFAMLLVVIIFPDIDSELGLKDIPAYISLIKYGADPGDYGYFFGVIMHGIWNFLKLNELTHMMLFIKILRLFFTGIITFSISILSIEKLDIKKNMKISFFWILAMISFNIYLFRNIIFTRFRLSLGLSFLFIGIFFLSKEKLNLLTKYLSLFVGIFFILVSIIIHELVLIISVCIAFGYFLFFIYDILNQKKLNFKVKPLILIFLLFIETLILLVLPILMSERNLAINIPFMIGREIAINMEGDFIQITVPLFITICSLLIIFQTLYLWKMNHLDLKDQFFFIFFTYFLIIGLFLTIPLIIIWPIEILFFGLNFLFWGLLFIKREKINFSKKDWIIFGLYLPFSTINRFQQYLYVTFDGKNLLGQFYAIEFSILIILFSKHFIYGNESIDQFINQIFGKIFHDVPKKLNVVKARNICFSIMMIILIQNSSLIIYGQLFSKRGTGFYLQNVDFYDKDEEFDQLAHQMVLDIMKLEENDTAPINISVNDLRISNRLMVLLMRETYYLQWYEEDVWSQSSELIMNHFKLNNSLILIAAINIPLNGFTPPNFVENEDYVLIKNYELGSLYLLNTSLKSS